jgi:hypothetical protein
MMTSKESMLAVASPMWCLRPSTSLAPYDFTFEAIRKNNVIFSMCISKKGQYRVDHFVEFNSKNESDSKLFTPLTFLE